MTTRRDFLISAAASTFAGAAAGVAPTLSVFAAESSKAPRLKKAVKYDMIKMNAPIKEKFGLIKSLGFQGVEVDSPSNINKEEAKKASEDTGIKIHGVIDSIHWNVRLSDPDEAVRAKGLEALKGALRDAKFFGADTVLLVPGKVADPLKENFEQVWERSTEQVRKALPVADETGVKIAIEVVWNNFITEPEQLVKYVDQFGTPAVGAYFDCSNMVKFGVPSAQWIRTLGKRMLKFDFKGYSNSKGWVKIGEGDENWPDVLKALDEIGYHGWATSEVAGGGPEQLKEVAERMNRVLGLS
jgi:L-ribulose-5-phosphate 3-epimerase